MGVLLIVSAISGASVAFLIYFGFAMVRDARRPHARRVLVLRLREVIARKRYQPRVLHMHKLDTILPASDRRMQR
jgi:hypothetical protein